LVSDHVVAGSTPCNDSGQVVAKHYNLTLASWEVNGNPFDVLPAQWKK